MKKSDVGLELQEYRERHGLTEKQMAEQFNLPEHEYTAYEAGAATSAPEMEQVLRNLLAQLKLGPPKPVKWYRSRKLHWPAPIIISFLFILALSTSRGYHVSYGSEEVYAEPPLRSYTIMAVFICGVYWACFRPGSLVKKKKKS